MPTCVKCSKNFPNLVKVDGKTRNLCNRKYCLDCSPFGNHNTRPLSDSPKSGLCNICSKPLTGKKRNRCGYCAVKVRRARLKLAAIALLGGKCNDCGFDQNPWVLEFHHWDDNKEFTISKKGSISWQKIKTEVEKCELLCANCHRMRHCTKNDPTFYAAVMDYNGELNIGK